MNTTSRRVTTQFAPEAQFEVIPVLFRGTQQIELERLKQKLLQQVLSENVNLALNAPLQRAANEAASLAWLTPYPLLVFPALLEEKTRVARLQTQRQARISQHSLALLAEVA